MMSEDARSHSSVRPLPLFTTYPCLHLLISEELIEQGVELKSRIFLGSVVSVFKVCPETETYRHGIIKNSSSFQ